MVLSPQETKHDSVSVGTVIVRIALLGVISIIYISIAVLIMFWSEHIKNLLSSGIVLMLGFSMICVPLYLIFRKK